MKLQTPVLFQNPPFTLHDQQIAVVGSCFAQYIAEQLALSNMAGLNANPFGVLYNPLSIARAFSILRTGERFVADQLVERDGLWHAMDFHGSFSAPTPDEVLRRINRVPVAHLDYIVVTLGTAYVYEREGRVVANCHKLPEKEFSRRLIGVAETLHALQTIAQLYPMAKIVATLSPIRHLRDGLVANSLSKATLRVALAEFCAESPENRVYFPAYEIVMDELRDYRFTEADMCHPTTQTRQYIWQRFSETMLDDTLRHAIAQGQATARAAAHRPLHSL